MSAPRRVGSHHHAPPRLGPLDRLRLRLTAWYVVTFSGIVTVLGGGLFIVVAHQIGADLDQRLDDAVGELIATTSSASRETAGMEPSVAALRVPGLSLYLFDAQGSPLLGDSMTALVRATVLRATRAGTASDQLPTRQEHQLRIFARSFRSRSGDVLVAAAAADLEDLEDRYTQLISQFVAAAVAAVALVALGGAFLARKSAVPVERAVEGMRRFMADAGHEMRTPVAVLRTEAEVALARSRDPADDARAFEAIVREAVRLSSVVDDLFTLARAESAELPMEREIVYLDDLVSDAVSATARRASEKRVALRLEEYEEAPVLGSATMLSRLAVILLDNAVKYTPEGGAITVSVRGAMETVTFEVSDTGPGIAPEVLPHVFDRFYRAEATRTAVAGAGLGLAIARWIAEAHDGALSLRSVPGSGTTACLTLRRTTPP